MTDSSATQTAGEPVTETGPALVRVTYRKSSIGYAHDQKATVAALGLRPVSYTHLDVYKRQAGRFPRRSSRSPSRRGARGAVR